MLKIKKSFSIEGEFSLSANIPNNLYSEEQIEKMKKLHPKINVDSFIKNDDGLLFKNRIVETGKKEILNVAFEGGTSLPFNFMAIGDGGYDFMSDARLFPSFDQTSLNNPIHTQEILSFSTVTGNAIDGYEKVLASTFFSSEIDPDLFSTQNRDEYYINEISVQTETGITFSILSFPNFPFNPADGIALTAQWYVRIF